MNRLKAVIGSKEIVLCPYIVEEMRKVVTRKFPNREKDNEVFLLSLPYTLVDTAEDIDVKKYPFIRDESDLPILVSAIIEDVDVLISGDKDLTTLIIDRPEILTPTAFLERYE